MKQNKALKETLGREISFDIYNRNIEDRKRYCHRNKQGCVYCHNKVILYFESKVE